MKPAGPDSWLGGGGGEVQVDAGPSRNVAKVTDISRRGESKDPNFYIQFQFTQLSPTL